MSNLEAVRRLQRVLAQGRAASGRPFWSVASLIDPDWATRLARRHPVLSAARPARSWQVVAVAIVLTGLVLSVAMFGRTALMGLLAILSPIFLCVVAIRAIALVELALASVGRSGSPSRSTPEPQWPVYTILVPLHGEDEIAADLVEALEAIDWPADRLEILFVVEADDVPTRQAVARAINRRGMRIVVVPRGYPQTKPRALMYALQLAIGDYVVVFDAEDIPEPDQLKRAYRVLAEGDGKIGCVQGRLNVYNADESWLSRQFALEYTALFDAVLPAFQRLGLPVPLGGTSNHFPRKVLEDIGGWDPFNVTEDADLGIRLARTGWQVAVIPSTTWEEAPTRLRAWLGQRRRWQKGWLQTYLVHTRQPGVLLRDLGLRGFFGFNLLMGGLVFSALIHPLALTVGLWQIASGGDILVRPASGIEQVLWWIGVINLPAAYILGMLVGAIAAIRRGFYSLVPHVLLMPIYWLLISYAAYAAAYEFATAPYWWEKTRHRRRHKSEPARRAGTEPASAP